MKIKSSANFINFILTLLILLCPMTSNATVYLPLSIEKQLSESYGVVRGIYQGSKYKKELSGKVVTVASFKVLDSVGIKQSDLINVNDFKITYPGGKWMGIVHYVHGAPKFTKGKEVVLLVNKGPHGFILSNFALGAYNVVNGKGPKYLSSSVFPNHVALGKIEFEKFSQHLFDIYGSRLHRKLFDKEINTRGRGISVSYHTESQKNIYQAKRSPASKDRTHDSQKNKPIDIMWLILIFALLGIVSVFFAKTKNK